MRFENCQSKSSGGAIYSVGQIEQHAGAAEGCEGSVGKQESGC